MPVYFTDNAPVCPISQDQPVGPSAAPTIRTTIPLAFDLRSAIIAVNITRDILNQIISNRVINNISDISVPGQVGRAGRNAGGGQPKPPKTINKLKTSRWSQKGTPVKNKYKYYAKDSKGNDDPDVWVITERIEHMVWYDSAWQTYLIWDYGDKGEGERQDSGGGGGGEGS